MRTKLLVIALALAALVFAGCGSSSSSATGARAATSPADPPAASAASARGPKLAVVESDYGRILADGRGHALYLFTADRGKRSSCSGDCAAVWPPYLVKRKPVAGTGVKGRKIGTIRRADGRLQATYAGHPVYFYVSDRERGQVLCQAASEFGGYWYVIRGSGRAVR